MNLGEGESKEIDVFRSERKEDVEVRKVAALESIAESLIILKHKVGRNLL